MVAMPNLVNLPKRQAIALIEGAGLEMGIPKYIPDISIDVVIKQLHNGREIQEGDSLQKGSVVDLVLGKGLSNQRTSVPNLVGMNFQSAKDRIFGASLTLVTSIYDNTVVSGRDSANAFVYKQNPDFTNESSLQLGSSIYLWLTIDSARIPVDSTLIVSDTIPEIMPEQSE
jgi:beta-lactam-binding protein with PASTA domain